MPADSDVWSALLQGPYGFLVVIAVLGWLGLKEWRKGREIDVDRERERAIRAEAEARATEIRADRDIKDLKEEVLKLQRQVFQLQRQLAGAGIITHFTEETP